MQPTVVQVLVPLALLAFVVYDATASECPSSLPTACHCENLVEGFRVACTTSADLNAIVIALQNDSIASLDVRDCVPPIRNIVSLPRFRVRTLVISGCGVESISTEALSAVSEDLEELVLANNSLTSVPLLGDLPKLEALNLNNNQLTDVAENAFEGTPRLRHIRLENNHICALANNALNETKPTLELLDLRGNCLTAVPAQNLRNSVKLMHLDLSRNRIDELAKMSFMNLLALKELRLHSNRLVDFTPAAFINVPKLSHLQVQGNRIKTVPEGALQMFKELESIDLSHNALTAMPPLKDLPNLKQVLLNNNRIRRLETMTFSNNPKLQIVDLDNNDISLISKNAFDGCDHLVILMLTNNSLTAIERGAFDGLRNLQQLELDSNKINELTNTSFISVPKVNVLDLSGNRISSIQPGTFERLTNLYWLNLSNNNLTSVAKDTFKKKVANILLHGNSFYCDDEFDWFVTYLVQNSVRTFFSNQPEITCAGPPKFEGTRLKDLMIKKANDTIVQGMNVLGVPPNQPNQAVNMLAGFLPGLANAGSNAGLLNSITQAIPSLRNLGNLPGTRAGQPGAPGAQNNLDAAIEQFTEPLVRLSTGGQALPSDVTQFANAIPNLIVNIPGFGDVDLSKVPPSLLQHVLNGGTLPGIPRETIDTVIKQYTAKMYDAARRAQANTPIPGDEKYLPALTTLPQDFIADPAKPIPFLNPDQSNVIREYYVNRIPIPGLSNASAPGKGNTSAINGTPVLTPNMLSMLELLPKGYDIKNLPQEVIQQVLHGQIPDMRLLPKEIIEHLQNNAHLIKKALSMVPQNTSLAEVLDRLPQFEVAKLNSTFTPYEISHVDRNNVISKANRFSPSQLRLYTAAALGFFGTVSIVILCVFCFHLKKKHRMSSATSSSTVQEIVSTGRGDQPEFWQGTLEGITSSSNRGNSNTSVPLELGVSLSPPKAHSTPRASSSRPMPVPSPMAMALSTSGGSSHSRSYGMA